MTEKKRGEEREIFLLGIKGVHATGYSLEERKRGKFVLLQGSRVQQWGDVQHAKKLPPRIKHSREKYHDKVKDSIVTEDIEFGSASGAANFVVSYRVNGLLSWKTQDGRTLRDVIDSETGGQKPV